MLKRYIPLVIALIVIVGTIRYLEKQKPQRVSVESNPLARSESSPVPAISDAPAPQDRTALLKQKAAIFSSGQELAGIQGYINTEPFKLADLVGKKVILVDFWTYSCINCLRTTPYLNAWYEKYKDKGFVIVGVHTPEFEFEKNYDNVAKAVKDFGIRYPVALDNDYATWNAYRNSYWPREYLIDIDGYIVHDKIGEGDYDGTERAIQKALEERRAVLGVNESIDAGIVAPKDVIPMDSSRIRSPEIYFGADRNQNLGNGTKGTTGTQTLSVPRVIDSSVLYLDGTWKFEGESVQSISNTAKIVLKYTAKNVYFVGSSEQGVVIKIMRDGMLLGLESGSDVDKDGNALIKDNRLYKLIEGFDYGEHTIEIEVTSPGLQAFTFTFG
ncbi:MAG: redoxin family protein [Candidatus Sungbacteria bacterium]|nr:redoxin family protein [Candidatus Sungbacteria bacterium]